MQQFSIRIDFCWSRLCRGIGTQTILFVISVTRFLKIRWVVFFVVVFVVCPVSSPSISFLILALHFPLVSFSISSPASLLHSPPPSSSHPSDCPASSSPLLSCPVAFSDAVIHSCSRHCLVVMWPKPAWQHGEQHSSGCCACPAHAHTLSCKHTHTH